MRIDEIELEDSDFYDKIQSDFLSRVWIHFAALFERENIRATFEPTLGLFTQENCIRSACLYLHSMPMYNLCIFCIVIINVIFLALDNPFNSPERDSVIFIADLVVAVIFCLDMITKIIAFGLVLPGAVDVATELRPSDVNLRDRKSVV